MTMNQHPLRLFQFNLQLGHVHAHNLVVNNLMASIHVNEVMLYMKNTADLPVIILHLHLADVVMVKGL